jgi:hypothetical protein
MEMADADASLKSMFDAATGADDGMTPAVFSSWCQDCSLCDRLSP